MSATTPPGEGGAGTSSGTLLPGEVAPNQKAAINQADQLRRTIADVYTFVRSREYNRAIESFTLDHYIDEAKRQIKDPTGGRTLRAASNPSVGTRPDKLTELLKLEEDFQAALQQAQQVAQQQAQNEQATVQSSAATSGAAADDE